MCLCRLSRSVRVVSTAVSVPFILYYLFIIYLAYFIVVWSLLLIHYLERCCCCCCCSAKTDAAPDGFFFVTFLFFLRVSPVALTATFYRISPSSINCNVHTTTASTLSFPMFFGTTQLSYRRKTNALVSPSRYRRPSFVSAESPPLGTIIREQEWQNKKCTKCQASAGNISSAEDGGRSVNTPLVFFVIAAG